MKLDSRKYLIRIIAYCFLMLVLVISSLVIVTIPKPGFTANNYPGGREYRGDMPVLKGTSYKTPSGTKVDVVDIPGIGKCIITHGGGFCK